MAFLSALLAGCANLSMKSDWSSKLFSFGQAEEPSVEMVNFQDLLTREPANTLLWLPQSPWGSDIHVLLHEQYAAASGRNCRNLTIDPDGRAAPALACQNPKHNKEWQAVRLLQIDGRPVLGDSSARAQTWSGR
ncbi:DVU3141 family protein [Thiocystis violacea]|uniref:DVU3141 family protein n=1 Tax=Thiocystis violacea TaxID=13725 RepID=UPI001F5C0650|nr:DVU3141 family protein [Thiocystis violacea]